MRVILIATTTVLLGGCPGPAPVSEPAPTKPAETPAKAADTGDSQAEQPQAAAVPLSEEDKRLIALDPAEITPELRRKRAYALRRRALQDPNSPLARTLEDLQKAYQDGEIDPNGSSMPTFTVDGKPPTPGDGSKGPAGTRMGPAGTRTPAQ